MQTSTPVAQGPSSGLGVLFLFRGSEASALAESSTSPMSGGKRITSAGAMPSASGAIRSRWAGALQVRSTEEGNSFAGRSRSALVKSRLVLSAVMALVFQVLHLL